MAGVQTTLKIIVPKIKMPGFLNDSMVALPYLIDSFWKMLYQKEPHLTQQI